MTLTCSNAAASIAHELQKHTVPVCLVRLRLLEPPLMLCITPHTTHGTSALALSKCTGQLLNVVDPATGQPLNPQQLKSEMAIATLAGFETTSNALSWTLGALACHTDVMTRLEQVGRREQFFCRQPTFGLPSTRLQPKT